MSPCYYPRVSISNFLGQANCSYFANSVSAGYNDVSDSWSMADGGTWTDTNYFGYITYPQVRVTCNSAKQSLTKTFNWQNP